ncbi:carbohydrate kinase family protein [Anaeromicropila herbilytica]|uniref:Kinase n=1 Tax=Anaeromicropila herbilytica TaxID=2785025 RepID=A0A7R7EKP7_9FIRM|nr:PfkB family carbohydrate kinase [Anaeromicropila herbilytica]BCN30470.1 kinase [Anaeromicropila herbilytica]
MKKVLVIGATALDMIINIEHLPKTTEDQHILSQSMALGGQAYNVSDILRHFKIPYTLISPIGNGMYARIVEEKLKEKGIVSPIHIMDGDNGFCLCMVEASGERTFLSYHGVEYRFKKDWMNAFNLEDYDSVYISGLEIEEETGIEIIELLEEIKGKMNPTIYFAPGPRINVIHEEKMSRLFSLNPILHLNEEEVMSYSGSKDIKDAIRQIFQKTNNTVFVTLGEKGVYCYNEECEVTVPTDKAKVVDTIGAGDSHMGAVICGIKMGLSIDKVLFQANKVSREVVQVQGATLNDEQFKKVVLESCQTGF